MPPGADPDFFLKEAIVNLRRNNWGALNLLLEYNRSQESLFKPGKNPGGLRGFLMSVQWSKEIANFSYINALFPGSRGILPSARLKARDFLPQTASVTVRPELLKYTDLYIFSFSLHSEKIIYVAFPTVIAVPIRRQRRLFYNYVRTMGVAFLKLSAESTASAASSCGFFSSEAGRCAASQADFDALRKEIRAKFAPGGLIRIHYNPEFDIDYQSLIFPDWQVKPQAVFFYSPSTVNHPFLSMEEKIYRGSCFTLASGKIPQTVENFENSFGLETSAPRGVWIWPDTFDPGRTSQGSFRMVYLRNFLCGDERIRLWDMERFSSPSAPGLVVFRSRKSELELDRAFSRHFAEKGSAILEVDASFDEEISARFFTDLFGRPGPLTGAAILASYRSLLPGLRNTRLIMPHITP